MDKIIPEQRGDVQPDAKLSEDPWKKAQSLEQARLRLKNSSQGVKHVTGSRGADFHRLKPRRILPSLSPENLSHDSSNRNINVLSIEQKPVLWYLPNIKTRIHLFENQCFVKKFSKVVPLFVLFPITCVITKINDKRQDFCILDATFWTSPNPRRQFSFQVEIRCNTLYLTAP